MALNFQDIIRDVHDPVNHVLQTSGGGATIFAVVNTGAVGVQNSLTTINPRTDYIGLMSVSGNVNVGNPTVFLGTPTLNAVVNIPSSVALNAGVNNIGFATVSVSNPTIYAVVNTSAQSGQATVNINGSATIFAVVNTGAAADPKIYIGLVTAVNGLAWPDPKTFIGLATTVNAGSTANIGSVSVLGGSIGLNAGIAGIGFATVKVDVGTKYIGLATVDMGVNKAWANPNTFIGLVTASNGLAWSDPHAFIGLATTVNGVGTQFIGLVTAWTRNAGTSKTLVSLPIGMAQGSIATVAVPTNAQTMYITNLLLNSDATVRITILSGVSYMAGNATLGITLNPGGGWVETGSPDSPTYIGNPSGAIVIQKFDMTGTSAKIGGKVVYFQE